MPRTVKCGLIQAHNAGPTDAPIAEIIRLNVEKHVAMIEDAAKQGVHDDLALAVALACWAGRRGKVGEVGLRLG